MMVVVIVIRQEAVITEEAGVVAAAGVPVVSTFPKTQAIIVGVPTLLASLLSLFLEHYFQVIIWGRGRRRGV